MESIIKKLKEITGKKHIRLTRRGNRSIDICLKIAKEMKKNKVLIQDQGGWIHYQKAPAKLGMVLRPVKTDHGMTDIRDLEKKADKETVFLCNSMPGYHALEDIDMIEEVCRERSCMLINDIAGSIGTENAAYGDIVIGSFGRWKPIDLEYGGFIATDNKEIFDRIGDTEFDHDKEAELLEKLDNLPERLSGLSSIRKKIIGDLKGFDIINKEKQGINVIIRFHDPEEKQEILDYCKKNSYEYTECPRYIRVSEPAISIEIKRLSK